METGVTGPARGKSPGALLKGLLIKLGGQGWFFSNLANGFNATWSLKPRSPSDLKGAFQAFPSERLSCRLVLAGVVRITRTVPCQASQVNKDLHLSSGFAVQCLQKDASIPTLAPPSLGSAAVPRAAEAKPKPQRPSHPSASSGTSTQTMPPVYEPSSSKKRPAKDVFQLTASIPKRSRSAKEDCSGPEPSEAQQAKISNSNSHRKSGNQHARGAAPSGLLSKRGQHDSPADALIYSPVTKKPNLNAGHDVRDESLADLLSPSKAGRDNAKARQANQASDAPKGPSTIRKLFTKHARQSGSRWTSNPANTYPSKPAKKPLTPQPFDIWGNDLATPPNPAGNPQHMTSPAASRHAAAPAPASVGPASNTAPIKKCSLAKLPSESAGKPLQGKSTAAGHAADPAPSSAGPAPSTTTTKTCSLVKIPSEPTANPRQGNYVAAQSAAGPAKASAVVSPDTSVNRVRRIAGAPSESAEKLQQGKASPAQHVAEPASSSAGPAPCSVSLQTKPPAQPAPVSVTLTSNISNERSAKPSAGPTPHALGPNYKCPARSPDTPKTRLLDIQEGVKLAALHAKPQSPRSSSQFPAIRAKLSRSTAHQHAAAASSGQQQANSEPRRRKLPPPIPRPPSDAAWLASATTQHFNFYHHGMPAWNGQTHSNWGLRRQHYSQHQPTYGTASFHQQAPWAQPPVQVQAVQHCVTALSLKWLLGAAPGSLSFEYCVHLCIACLLDTLPWCSGALSCSTFMGSQLNGGHALRH